jgi:hypothetical protein
MFGNMDEWPVWCPQCGGVNLKAIGWLLENTSLTCGCGATLAWYRECMERDLEDAYRAVVHFSRGLRVEKSGNDSFHVKSSAAQRRNQLPSA